MSKGFFLAEIATNVGCAYKDVGCAYKELEHIHHKSVLGSIFSYYHVWAYRFHTVISFYRTFWTDSSDTVITV